MNIISNIEKDNDELCFSINNKDSKLKTSLVNGIRRVIISDIPIYALSTVKINFITNTCIFDNEYIKHRLGLVAIKNNVLDNYDNIVFNVNKKNTDSNSLISVYLKDFEVIQEKTKIKNSDFFKYPDTLITKLKLGQEIHIEGTIDQGIGREDARYTPVSTAVYFFDYDKDERDYKKDNNDYPIKYNYIIESSGQYSPKKLLIKSIEILIEKNKIIKDDLVFKKGKITKLMNAPTKLKAIDIELVNENDTFGNLITQYIIEDEKDIDLKYCGYHIPHPLKNILVIRLSYKDNSKDTIIKLVSDTINKINNILNELLKEVKTI